MPRNNTGNPVPSASPLDRYDNSLILDELVSSKNKEEVPDRLGEPLMTWHEIQNGYKKQLIAGGRIFDSEAEGRDAVEDDQYYFAVSNDPGVSKALWQRISSSESRWIADDPSAEFMQGVASAQHAAIDLASQPNLTNGEFYYGNETRQSIFSITDENGNELAAWDYEGYQITQLRGEFHNDDSPSIYAIVDSSGVVFYAVAESGENTIGGGSEVPFTESGASSPQVYRNNGVVCTATELNALYTRVVSELTRPHTRAYEFYDSLNLPIEVIGYSERGSEIRMYTFDPPALSESDFVRLHTPKPIEIVLTAGLHGNETGAQIGTMIFINRLINEWRDDPRLATLRWGCRLKIIPCANPDGIDDGTRRNANGVDINRNFPVGWDIGGGLSPGDSGPSAASESETRALMSVPELTPDAVCYIDYHTHFNNSFNQWFASAFQRDVNLAVEHIREQFAKEASILGLDAPMFETARIQERTQFGGMLGQWVWEDGISSEFLIEHSQNNVANSIENRRIAQEVLLALVYKIYRREANVRANVPSEII
ncbi:M14 family metallopeptidase [Halomonas sp. AOP27-A1-34]|uniref:M14 family metallopeptidase n=1 Tax=Halomonas sp. AOP27-A1-34 TaxID=3457708 RepID=UPI0040348C38